MTTVSKNQRPTSILVVDDEPIILESLAEWFRQDGYEVETEADARQALRLAEQRDFDIAFVDIRMPHMDGLELQKRLAATSPELTIIIMTAYASVDTAVQALKAGAFDYIIKPFDPDALSHLVRRIDEHRSLRSENVLLKERLEEVSAPSPIVGKSRAMQEVMDLITVVSDTDSTVLIKGESGTGKELVARAIHAQSSRRYGPMVVVNCGALAEGVVESELFGHEKGAFTGAHYRRKGKFEQADGGTIFLDEIGSVGQKVQVELLRIVEEKTVTRVGGNEQVPVDFRILAATNQDLEQLAADGVFRDDLFWRLNVFTIKIPPLRERPEDIEVLANHFLERFTIAMNRSPLKLSASALRALTAHSWPGNVRELQNAIERAVVVGSPPCVEAEDLSLRILHAKSRPGPMSLSQVVKAHILSVLETADWNISRAAKTLQVDRGTLYNKIQKYGLKKPTGRR
jgi:DNA-binding NtrC family response regulator